MLAFCSSRMCENRQSRNRRKKRGKILVVVLTPDCQSSIIEQSTNTRGFECSTVSSSQLIAGIKKPSSRNFLAKNRSENGWMKARADIRTNAPNRLEIITVHSDTDTNIPNESTKNTRFFLVQKRQPIRETITIVFLRIFIR